MSIDECGGRSPDCRSSSGSYSMNSEERGGRSTSRGRYGVSIKCIEGQLSVGQRTQRDRLTPLETEHRGTRSVAGTYRQRDGNARPQQLNNAAAVTDIGREQSLEPIDLHSNFFIEGMRVHGVDYAGEWVEGARVRGLCEDLANAAITSLTQD